MPKFYSTYKSSLKKNPPSAVPVNARKTTRTGCPVNVLDIERLSYAPGFDPNKLPLYLKRLLIYYPKNSRSLRPLNMIFSSECNINEVGQKLKIRTKKLVADILSRYKKIFFKQICVGIYNRDYFVEKLAGAVERMIVFPGQSVTERPILAIKKFFVNNKRLRSVSIYENLSMPICISGWLQYLPFLESIALRGLYYLPPGESLRVFSNSRGCLKEIIIDGGVHGKYQENYDDFTSLLYDIVDINGLQKFKLNIEAFIGLNLDKLPFEKFKQRNVTYYIKTFRCHVNPELSETTASALSNLDVLALNFEENGQRLTNPAIQTYRDETQKATNNMLHMYLDNQIPENLPPLLQACKNISTLDLILGPSNKFDFSALQHLTSLKHLYLCLSYPKCGIDQLSSSLAALFSQNATLETFILHDCVTSNDCLSFLPVFEACKDSLTKFVIAFGSFQNPNLQSALCNNTYQLLGRLKNLKSLAIYSESGSLTRDRLTKLVPQHDTLEELHLSSPVDVQTGDLDKVELNLKNPSSIRKLKLDINKLDSIVNFQAQMNILKELTHLELRIGDVDQATWHKLRQALREFEKLETFILHSRQFLDIEVIKTDFGILIKKQSNIKNIILKQLLGRFITEGPIVFIFRKLTLV